MNPRSVRKRWMAAPSGQGNAAETPRGIPRPEANSSRAAKPASSALRAGEILNHPADLALTSERRRMRLVDHLRAGGIRNEAVLDAMREIERHRFVDEGLASRAYEDHSLPIGHAQTISQPHIVAAMTELLLAAGSLGKVLEIGTGCGYQTAILSKVVGEVYSIERIRALHDKARANLRPLRLANVRLIYGDGLAGFPEAAPFDAMLIAAAGDDLPQGLLDQLRIGGRAVAPLSSGERPGREGDRAYERDAGGGPGGPAGRDAGRDTSQRLWLIMRTGEHSWARTKLEAVRFVPLRSGLI